MLVTINFIFRPDGKVIDVDFSENVDEASKIKVGEFVTVKYFGTNVNGIFQSPKFFEVK